MHTVTSQITNTYNLHFHGRQPHVAFGEGALVSSLFTELNLKTKRQYFHELQRWHESLIPYMMDKNFSFGRTVVDGEII